MTSLYSVPDEETEMLMENFYGALKSGRKKLDALHQGQLELIRGLRKRDGSAHPFFWGSFVLVGDPD